jgi:hypothetical protein
MYWKWIIDSKTWQSSIFLNTLHFFFVKCRAVFFGKLFGNLQMIFLVYRQLGFLQSNKTLFLYSNNLLPPWSPVLFEEGMGECLSDSFPLFTDE